MRIWTLGLAAALAAGASGAGAAPPPIAAYGQLPAMQDAALSPTGALFAYVGAAKDKRFVVVRNSDDGKVIQSVDTNGRKIRLLRWADDGHLLIAFSGTYDYGGGTDAKAEIGVVMLANLKRRSLIQLAPSDNGVEGEPLAVTSEGGRAYGYFPGRGDTIKRIDLDSNQVVTAYTLPPHVDSVAMGPDSKVVARVETNDYGRNWRVMAGLDSQRVLASGRSEHGEAQIATFGRTPDTILFAKPEDDEFDNMREMSLKDGKLGAKLTDAAAAVTPIRDRKTRLLIGVHLEGADEDEVFFDPKLAEMWASARAAFPKSRVRLESFSDDMKRWIVHTDGDRDAGHFYLLDLAQRKAIPLGADYPEVKADDVASVRWFDYAAQDGTRLQGVLTIPAGRDPRLLPVVVMPHGGPAGHDTVHFDWWSQAIASRGYAVFQPNFRGSNGYGRAFERAGWGQWGKLMQTDVSDGLRALEAKGIVDPKRACIVGWSYGGYATLAGVTLQNGLYRCAAAGGAVSDLSGMLTYELGRSESAKSPVNRYWRASMALKGPGDPAAAAASPARYANRADAPLLLIHGRDDTVVPFSQAQEMAQALRAANKPVELLVLNGEDHWLSSGETRTKMLEGMIGFLEKQNPPEAAPAKLASQ